jgi:hypothetical protein
MAKKVIALIMALLPIIFSLSTLTVLMHYNGNAANTTSQVVKPDSLPKTGDLLLWSTQGFTGNWNGNNQVFWGTAYYYYVGYPGGESNPGSNWYIVATQFFKGSGSDAADIGGIYTSMALYSNQVWNVNANPISKNPISTGSASVGLGSSASVTVSVGYNGYDTGTVSGGNASYYGEFDWQHSYTMADQDTWGTMSGAYCGKVSATNSQASVEGSVSVQYYMWWTGGWNPFASGSGWVYATYNSGASQYQFYPNSVA